MTHMPQPRPHLAERAVQALGPNILAGGASSSEVQAPASIPAPPPAPAVVSPAADAAPSSPAVPVSIALEALRGAGMVVGAAAVARSRVGEEIGVVQQAVLRTMRGITREERRAPRAVLVTSARPGEGKSFTSLNLAAVIAAGGTPVLLVDADGKRGSLTELLQVADAPGLRQLAAEPRMAVSPLPVPTSEPRFSFLPYGAPVPGMPSVPPSQLMADALLRVAAAMPNHVLIVDSPPCLATSEPGAFAAVVGQVLMVVEAERTQRAEVEAALDLVDACPLLQLMLNRTRLSTGDSFGSYAGYGSYGGYGTYAPPSGS